MSDQKRTQMSLRISLCELKLIIIDEMVGNTSLLHIHQRLREKFDTNNSQLFAGISIIALSDYITYPQFKVCNSLIIMQIMHLIFVTLGMHLR